VPYSGKPDDAFPSGHAIHVGAMASAATVLPPAKRKLAWSIGAGLVVMRIVLLAHWTSDVIAGLAIGVAVERLLRRWTGFGQRRRCKEPKLDEGFASKSGRDCGQRAPSA
jgi:undecaprenyl-diphosphatase